MVAQFFSIYEKETRALKVWDFNLLVESLGMVA
jgi:hypothetical protein